MARSSSGGVAIRYVLPVFMDDVKFGRSGTYGDAWKAEHFYLLPVAALRYWGGVR